MMRLAALSVLAFLLGACASQGGPAWISAAKFDYDGYAHRHVAVVPVTFADSLDTSQFPAKPLQQAISDQLDVFGLRDVTSIEHEASDNVSFPATPKRLAAFGAAHHFDAVVGATVVRFDHRRHGKKGWSFTGNITFVDVAHPERRWTLAKTWTFTDQPGANSSKLDLDYAMIDDFFDVRRAQQYGADSVLLRPNTEVAELGPVLNLDIADAPRKLGKPALKSAISNQEQQIYSTSAAITQVDVLAIDDDGIASLGLDTTTGFNTEVYRSAPAVDSTATNPIYVAQRVSVPLQMGENEIRVIGANGAGQKVARSIFVRRTADDSLTGRTDLIVVVASSYAAHPPDTLQADSAALISDAQAQNGGIDNGHSVLTLTDRNATRSAVLRTVTSEWSRPADGATRRFLFVGRAEVIEGRPYLLMYDADKEHPDIGSMSVDELAALANFNVQQFDLDLCTNAADAASVQQAVEKTIDAALQHMHSTQRIAPDVATPFKVSVRGACSAPIGSALQQLARPSEGKMP